MPVVIISKNKCWLSQFYPAIEVFVRYKHHQIYVYESIDILVPC